MENWEHAMIALGVAFDPVGIHLKVRAYIDEWIDTGFLSDGSEVPDSRGIRPASNAPSARAALALMENRIRPKMRFDLRGGITFDPIGFPSPTLENFAGEIFVELYCSEWLFRIMRCNRCKAIFLPDREPRKRYERGWHCSKCRNSAAAQAATDAKRAEFRRRWFALAVNAYTEYHGSARRTTNGLTQFVTSRVNEGLPLGGKVKRNRITRNLAEIQIEAERRQNGKG
jgi:hypothetical protein